MSTTKLMERMTDRAQRMELAEASDGTALAAADGSYIALSDNAFGHSSPEQSIEDQRQSQNPDRDRYTPSCRPRRR